MEYEVYGKIKFEVSIDIEADTEEQAIQLAKEKLADMYTLDVIGAFHRKDDVEYDLDAVEYEDED